ncbi:RNA-directed DNA polymerase -like protein [Trichinella zimbabwensis]|uniref:RNA-directed DNA polymerase-like protein n=1 Tax=Trichinella zimbabwensis TaxID=268475 RepID=A0A0V1HGS9_9BILA|nr:RNA-directed DNA polymerase -like protein [Trichinella zimbabwensis]
MRSLPFAQREEVHMQVRRMLEQGLIEPVTDRHSFFDDYQKHNEIIRKDAQPMPRIIKTTDASAGSKWFTKLDLASGYWMVVVDERGHEKPA